MVIKRMTELSYMAKLKFQLAENRHNVTRANNACRDKGLDTSITMGQAIHSFTTKYNLYNVLEEKFSPYHDAMHIIGLSPTPSPQNEAITGLTEYTLLREPYNGNENQINKNARASLLSVMHRFNGARHEDFDEAAPIPEYRFAKDLGQERFLMTITLSGKDIKTEKAVTEDEYQAAYAHAKNIDTFFQTLMGERAIYQLSTQELLETPLCFFGIEPDGTLENSTFKSISDSTKKQIIENLGQATKPLFVAQFARTEAELQKLYPQSPNLDLVSSDLSNQSYE